MIECAAVGFHVFPTAAPIGFGKKPCYKNLINPMNRAATILFYLLFLLRAIGAQQTIVTGNNPNDGAGDSLRNAFRKVNSNFTELYNTGVFTNSTFPWSSITETPVTLSGYGITDSITSASVTNYYATKASPTFTGTVTIPSGASISGYLTTATAASTYAPLTGSGASGSWGISITGNAATATLATNATSATSATAATTATNLLGGSAGSLPYQTGSGATTTLGIGSANTVLTSSGTAPQWSSALSGLSSIGITGGSVSSSTPLVNGTQTWTGGGTFTGHLLNITDTSSSASSSFADWQISGSSKLSIIKSGKIVGNGANPYLFLDNAAGSQLGYGTGILNNGGSSLTWAASGTEVARVDNAGLVSVASGGGYQWSSTSASSGTKDLFLLRDAANTLALRNGTTAQSLRIYNTFTDASNYERGVFDWSTSANTLTIGAKNAGTGTQRKVAFDASSYDFNFAGSASFSLSSSALTPNVDGGYSVGTSANRINFLYIKGGIYNANAEDALSIRSTSASGWSDVLFRDSANSPKGAIGWGNASASSFPNTFFIQANSTDLVIYGGASGVTESARFLTGGGMTISGSGVTVTSATDGGVSLGTSSANRFNNIYGKAQIAATGAASSIEAWNTDASVGGTAWEKGVFDWTTSANTLTIGTQKGPTGNARAVNFCVGGTTYANITSAGVFGIFGSLVLPKIITSAGTTGAQTISKTSGSVNFAAAATSLVVTSTLCSTTSVIIATVASNDATMKSVAVVAGSGSFTIYPNAAPTAETRVNFIITN